MTNENDTDLKFYVSLGKLYKLSTIHGVALKLIKQQCRAITEFIDEKGKVLPSIQKALVLQQMIASLQTNCLTLTKKDHKIKDLLKEEADKKEAELKKALNLKKEDNIISLESYKEKEEN